MAAAFEDLVSSNNLGVPHLSLFMNELTATCNSNICQGFTNDLCEN